MIACWVPSKTCKALENLVKAIAAFWIPNKYFILSKNCKVGSAHPLFCHFKFITKRCPIKQTNIFCSFGFLRLKSCAVDPKQRPQANKIKMMVLRERGEDSQSGLIYLSFSSSSLWFIDAPDIVYNDFDSEIVNEFLYKLWKSGAKSWRFLAKICFCGLKFT